MWTIEAFMQRLLLLLVPGVCVCVYIRPHALWWLWIQTCSHTDAPLLHFTGTFHMKHPHAHSCRQTDRCRSSVCKDLTDGVCKHTGIFWLFEQQQWTAHVSKCLLAKCTSGNSVTSCNVGFVCGFLTLGTLMCGCIKQHFAKSKCSKLNIFDTFNALILVKVSGNTSFFSSFHHPG